MASSSSSSSSSTSRSPQKPHRLPASAVSASPSKRKALVLLPRGREEEEEEEDDNGLREEDGALAQFERHAQACNRALAHLHEGAAPKFTSEQRRRWNVDDDEYGGITGTITPGGMLRFARAVCKPTAALPAAAAEGSVRRHDILLRRGESVFCDIGCGTGRPTFYFAGLPIKCSLGFDVDSLQLLNCGAGYTRLTSRSSTSFQCPLLLFKADAYALKSLSPVTHAYAFLGYSEFAEEIARLVVATETMRVVMFTALKLHDLVRSGFLSKDKTLDEDVILLPGMHMPGGSAYLGVVIPITEARRKRMAAVRAGVVPARPTREQGGGEADLTRRVMQAMQSPGVDLGTESSESAVAEPGGGAAPAKRPRRACRR